MSDISDLDKPIGFTPNSNTIGAQGNAKPKSKGTTRELFKFRIDSADLEKLKKLADEKGTSVSALIREYIKAGLRKAISF